jgi:hypothetical protein
MALDKLQGIDWLVKLQANEALTDAAVTTGSGLLTLSTDQQAITGTATTVAITPANLMAALAALTFPIATSSGVKSSGTLGIGYATGAGGAVTQATSRTTTVALNKLCGTITMFSAAQAADALVTFTFTNTLIAATDLLIVKHVSATDGGAWNVSTVCSAGSATISIRNVSQGSITSATPLQFMVLKGVAA